MQALSSTQATADTKVALSSFKEAKHLETPRAGYNDALNEHMQHLESALDEAMMEETKLREELIKINRYDAMSP
jgi:hypothetical protein